MKPILFQLISGLNQRQFSIDSELEAAYKPLLCSKEIELKDARNRLHNPETINRI
jgi:hypothetical protein